MDLSTIILGITSIVAVKITRTYAEKFDALIASALPSFMIGLVCFLLNKLYTNQNELITQIPVIYFGASFVGMTSSKVLPNQWKWAIVSGIIFVLIFSNANKVLSGIGGGLGTTAMLSVLSTVAFFRLAKTFVDNRSSHL